MYKCVHEEVFFHIQRLDSLCVPWKIGDTIFIGDIKNQFFGMYDTFPITEMDTIENILNEYVIFARETLFEEVRQNYFPELPSRQKCIWLIPPNNEQITFWLNALKCPDGKYQILKLECSGKVFFANEKYLKNTLGNFNLIRGNAFNYWSGHDADETYLGIECLFNGFVNVVDILKDGPRQTL